MDKKKNALFRAKLEERKKNQVKRIDHPLIRLYSGLWLVQFIVLQVLISFSRTWVCFYSLENLLGLLRPGLAYYKFFGLIDRYNDNDQPVCKVCDLALKSDLLWDAHQVSARHHQAIKNLKGSAARVTEVNSVKPKHQTEQLQLKTDSVKSVHPNVADTEKSGILEQGPSHTLPADFFDNSKETKRQKTGNISAPVAKVSSHDNMGPPADRTPAKAVAPEADAVDTAPTPSTGSLPAGFFDNKDADLRARGIKPVKPNVNDEYKEFEKLIQDDLQEVDNRLEEEEIDAAEMIEIAETLEQRAYREKVERLKNLKMKVAEAKSSASKQEGAASRKVTVDEESSSDSDGDYDDSTVDWRAQHL